MLLLIPKTTMTKRIVRQWDTLKIDQTRWFDDMPQLRQLFKCSMWWSPVRLHLPICINHCSCSHEYVKSGTIVTGTDKCISRRQTNTAVDERTRATKCLCSKRVLILTDVPDPQRFRVVSRTATYYYILSGSEREWAETDKSHRPSGCTD